MRGQNQIDFIEFQDDVSEEVREAYTDELYSLSEGLKLDPEYEDVINVHVGDYVIEKDSAFVRLSDTEEYTEEMVDLYSLEPGVEEIFENSEYPVHEVSESAGHVIGDISAENRPNEDISDVLVHEIFGAIGLAFSDSRLLRNDARIISRNLDIQRDFYSSPQEDFVVDNLDRYRSVNSSLVENYGKKDTRNFLRHFEELRHNLFDECPLKLEDVEEYSWSKEDDPGSFSELFIESMVTPLDIASGIERNEISRSQAIDELNNVGEDLRNMGRDEVKKARKETHNQATELNRAYLISRTLVEKSLQGELLPPQQLVRMDNKSIKTELKHEVNRLDRKIRQKYDIPDSQSSNRLIDLEE